VTRLPEPSAAAVVVLRSEAVQQKSEQAGAAVSIEDLAALLTTEPAPGGDIKSGPNDVEPSDGRQAQAPTVRHLASTPVVVEIPSPRVTEAMHRASAPVADEAREQPKETSQAALRASGAPRVDVALPTLEAQRVVAAPPTSQAAQSVASPEPVHAEADVASQIVQSMRILAADGGGEARVRLRPEYLGEVLILLKVENGAVNASVQAESPAVRQWAETNEHVLRQGLGTHGLRLEQLTVSDADVQSSTPERQADDHSPDPDQRRQQQRPRRHHAESGHERFEVVL
jgi:flagellar hook-length control protein FliK